MEKEIVLHLYGCKSLSKESMKQFHYKDSLCATESLVIRGNNSLDYVEPFFFSCLPYLKKIVFEEQVSLICSNAFLLCPLLEEVCFQKGVGVIAREAFIGCLSLKNIVVNARTVVYSDSFDSITKVSRLEDKKNKVERTKFLKKYVAFQGKDFKTIYVDQDTKKQILITKKKWQYAIVPESDNNYYICDSSFAKTDTFRNYDRKIPEKDILPFFVPKNAFFYFKKVMTMIPKQLALAGIHFSHFHPGGCVKDSGYPSTEGVIRVTIPFAMLCTYMGSTCTFTKIKPYSYVLPFSNISFMDSLLSQYKERKEGDFILMAHALNAKDAKQIYLEGKGKEIFLDKSLIDSLFASSKEASLAKESARMREQLSMSSPKMKLEKLESFVNNLVNNPELEKMNHKLAKLIVESRVDFTDLLMNTTDAKSFYKKAGVMLREIILPRMFDRADFQVENKIDAYLFLKENSYFMYEKAKEEFKNFLQNHNENRLARTTMFREFNEILEVPEYEKLKTYCPDDLAEDTIINKFREFVEFIRNDFILRVEICSKDWNLAKDYMKKFSHIIEAMGSLESEKEASEIVLTISHIGRAEELYDCFINAPARNLIEEQSKFNPKEITDDQLLETFQKYIFFLKRNFTEKASQKEQELAANYMKEYARKFSELDMSEDAITLADEIANKKETSFCHLTFVLALSPSMAGAAYLPSAIEEELPMPCSFQEAFHLVEKNFPSSSFRDLIELLDTRRDRPEVKQALDEMRDRENQERLRKSIEKNQRELKKDLDQMIDHYLQEEKAKEERRLQEIQEKKAAKEGARLEQERKEKEKEQKESYCVSKNTLSGNASSVSKKITPSAPKEIPPAEWNLPPAITTDMVARREIISYLSCLDRITYLDFRELKERQEEFIRKGDYGNAFFIATKLNDKNWLATSYYYGLGVELNHDKAYEICIKVKQNEGGKVYFESKYARLLFVYGELQRNGRQKYGVQKKGKEEPLWVFKNRLADNFKNELGIPVTIDETYSGFSQDDQGNYFFSKVTFTISISKSDRENYIQSYNKHSLERNYWSEHEEGFQVANKNTEMYSRYKGYREAVDTLHAGSQAASSNDYFGAVVDSQQGFKKDCSNAFHKTLNELNDTTFYTTRDIIGLLNKQAIPKILDKLERVYILSKSAIYKFK